MKVGKLYYLSIRTSVKGQSQKESDIQRIANCSINLIVWKHNSGTTFGNWNIMPHNWQGKRTQLSLSSCCFIPSKLEMILCTLCHYLEKVFFMILFQYSLKSHYHKVLFNLVYIMRAEFFLLFTNISQNLRNMISRSLSSTWHRKSTQKTLVEWN